MELAFITVWALTLIKCRHDNNILFFTCSNLIFGYSVLQYVSGPAYFALSAIQFFAIAKYLSYKNDSMKVVEVCVHAVFLNLLGVVLWYFYFTPVIYQAMFLILYLYMFLTTKRQTNDSTDIGTEHTSKSLLNMFILSFKDTLKFKKQKKEA